MSETLRRAVVAEALSWMRTPYMNNARVKGENGGADCLTFLAGAYENAGVIERLPIPHYPHDWHLHQTAEHYLLGKDETPGVLHFCEEVDAPPERIPLPADIVMWKFGHCYAHAAIVTEWPMVVHSWFRCGVTLDDANRHPHLSKVFEIHALRGTVRPRRFFRVKGW